MKETQKNESQLPDFELPTYYSPDKLADKLVSKEAEYKSKLTSKQAKGIRPSWFFVITLFLITVALAVFVFESNSQLSNLKNQLTDLQNNDNQSSSNISQQLPYPPITAYGFTILPQLRPPLQFESKRELGQSRFFENREMVKSSFLFEYNALSSGVVVEVVEYDNRLNLEEFAELVATTLGQGFSSSQETVLLPDNIQLMKVKSEKADIDYYTSVTTENYYFITIYKQTKQLQEFEEVNQFTDTILGSLYLN
jgi:hypothetical protein